MRSLIPGVFAVEDREEMRSVSPRHSINFVTFPMMLAQPSRRTKFRKPLLHPGSRALIALAMIWGAVLLSPPSSAVAGLRWQKLEEMIADVDSVAVVEVTDIAAPSITFETLETHVGEALPEIISIEYRLPPTRIGDAFVSPIVPGSGLETRLKVGGKYVFLFDHVIDLKLLRAEPANGLAEVLTAWKEADPDAKRVASARDARFVLQSYVSLYLNRQVDRFAELYAEEVLLLPGHEMLKKRYGIAGDDGRGVEKQVKAEALVAAIEEMFEVWSGPSQEEIEGYLQTMKYEILDAGEGDFAIDPSDPVSTPDKKLHLSIETGDFVFRVGPPDEDFLIFQLRKVEGYWRIVAEYVD